MRKELTTEQSLLLKLWEQFSTEDVVCGIIVRNGGDLPVLKDLYDYLIKNKIINEDGFVNRNYRSGYCAWCEEYDDRLWYEEIHNVYLCHDCFIRYADIDDYDN